MNNPILIHTIAAALILPLVGLAQDTADPSKGSDAARNPPAAAPACLSEPVRIPGTSESEPGKISDRVKKVAPAATLREFAGPITAVSRDEKTITITDSKMGAHKLHIDETTEFKNGEKKGTWDDLKVGTKVSGTCRTTKEAAHAETLMIRE